jgi:hypothetical protein
MKTNREFQDLTLERAKSLKGKTIVYNYPYNQSRLPKKMTVGDIISVWDYNKTQPMEGWANRTEQWASWMTEKEIEREKNMLMLLNADGTDSYLYCESLVNWEEGPTFHCSDSDRLVVYRELEEDEDWDELLADWAKPKQTEAAPTAPAPVPTCPEWLRKPVKLKRGYRYCVDGWDETYATLDELKRDVWFQSDRKQYQGATVYRINGEVSDPWFGRTIEITKRGVILHKI